MPPRIFLNSLRIGFGASVVFLVTLSHFCWAGNNFRSSVGGVTIDAQGVLRPTGPEAITVFRQVMEQRVAKAEADMNRTVPLRKISLSALQHELRAAGHENTAEIPEEHRFLGGLQRIEYVLVYPDRQDIVLAGPGEGWTIDEMGTVVGITTGQPVLQLDDLLVALRTVRSDQKEQISCSIEPTVDGMRALAAFLAQQRTMSPAVLRGVEQALGPQQIHLTGIPQGSNFAHVMVAADYRMKRLAMKLDKSPVRGLASYLDLLRSAKQAKQTPRWWLACNYEPLGRSHDGLAWQLRGQGVKVMTEESFIDQGNGLRGTGKTSAAAQQWADQITDSYAALAAEEPVFAALRNLMDMCVVAALIEREDFEGRSGCDLSLLNSTDSRLQVGNLEIPRTIATEASTIKKGRQHVITASGGVELDPWPMIREIQTDARINAIWKAGESQDSSVFWAN